MQRRLDTKTDVNKPFENASCQGRIQNFFQAGGTNFVAFSSVVVFSRANFKQLKYQKRLLGVRGHASGKFLKIHILIMAILVLFEQFLRKACHIFGP